MVCTGLAPGLSNWDAIRVFAAVHMLTPRFLLLMWLVYPFVKALHELGHGLAVKAWGGEVRETGISLLLLVPVPFVDASAASAFPEKRRRMLVGAAGIMVELLLAAGALLIWTHVSDGVVRDIAFIVMVIGGMSTVLVQRQPAAAIRWLLHSVGRNRHTQSRAAQHGVRRGTLRSVTCCGCNRQILRSRRVESRNFCSRMQRWPFAYRWFVSVLIVFWAGHYSFWLGILAGLFILATMAVKPLFDVARFLRTAPQLARQRTRGYAVAGGITVAIAGAAMRWSPCLSPLWLRA